MNAPVSQPGEQLQKKGGSDHGVACGGMAVAWPDMVLSAQFVEVGRGRRVKRAGNGIYPPGQVPRIQYFVLQFAASQGLEGFIDHCDVKTDMMSH